MSTLYEISADIIRVIDLFENEEIDEDIARDTLESLKFDLENKAVAYCKAMKNLESDREAIKSEIERLNGRVKSIDRTIERMKNNLYNAMVATNTNKIKSDLFSLTIANRAPQLPQNLDDYNIPAEYYIEQPPKIDRKKLLSDIKVGKVATISKDDLQYSKGLNIR